MPCYTGDMPATPPPVLSVDLPDASSTEHWAGQLAHAATAPLAIYLEGDLGAGKTTFSRGFLRGLGFSGSVKSPTYTLIEPYEVGGVAVFHCDLYRLADPGELEYLGLGDHFAERAIMLIEWPARGGALLPAPDVKIQFEVTPEGRRLSISSHSARGLALAAALG